ncbi:MAG TPA: hypothetical protein VJB94_02260 [Candidatus Nanoarchaeia archaeon]|nr:hypothetical protein [Candidatus Nanoarchaeia archaeon]
MVYNIPLWQEISIYIYVLFAIACFALLSKIKIFGMNLINLKYRILISIFSPLILVLLIALLPLIIIAAIFGLTFLKKANKAFKIEIKRF